jgi:hypothetical protein
MLTIGVVQCGKSKRSAAAPAQDLYIGSLFRSLRRAAESSCERWYILSARHGLIHPETHLEPYDMTVAKNADPAWVRETVSRLRGFEPRGWDRLVLFGSARYAQGWAEELGAETPFVGLEIGRMLASAKSWRTDALAAQLSREAAAGDPL